MQDNKPLHVVSSIYDHEDTHSTSHETRFLAHYAGKKFPVWQAAWNFFSYDDRYELYVTDAFLNYCRSKGLMYLVYVPSPRQLNEQLRNCAFC